MDRGLYLAASGMLTEQIRQDQIANDLANASTAGYKAERTTQQSFGEMLLTNSVTGQQVGRVTTGVAVTNTQTDWSPGVLKDTGEPLDFAINGDGFFAVQTGAGPRYTRNGQFSSDPQGRLTTLEGDLVLGRNGQPVTLGADGKVDPRTLNVVTLYGPREGRQLLRHRHPGQRRGPDRRQRSRRRARGLRRRPRPDHGGHDGLLPGLRVRPEGHPHHRRDPRQGRFVRRIPYLVQVAQRRSRSR